MKEGRENAGEFDIWHIIWNYETSGKQLTTDGGIVMRPVILEVCDNEGKLGVAGFVEGVFPEQGIPTEGQTIEFLPGVKGRVREAFDLEVKDRRISIRVEASEDAITRLKQHILPGKYNEFPAPWKVG